MKVHDARDGFNDLKPDFLLGGDPLPWLAAILIVILVLFLVRIFRRKPEAIQSIKRKKLEEFLAEIEKEELKLKNDEVSPKSVAASASIVLRSYISDRSGISILECTPKEAEERLSNRSGSFIEFRGAISKLLFQLENISFSKENTDGLSEKEKCQQMLQTGKELLRKIESQTFQGLNT